MTSIGMKQSATLAALALLLSACQAEETPGPAIVTIDKAPAQIMPVELPPQVDEEVTAVIPKNMMNLTAAERARIEAAAQDERVVLPFAPAIAMDPVDGQKVSIRKNTPTFEYKKKIYYFTSETNRRMFMANPETYTKGSLAKYQ